MRAHVPLLAFGLAALLMGAAELSAAPPRERQPGTATVVGPIVEFEHGQVAPAAAVRMMGRPSERFMYGNNRRSGPRQNGFTLPAGRRYYNGRYFGNFNNRYYGPQYGYF
jgi:hypothetical protein